MPCAIVYAMNNFLKNAVKWTLFALPVIALIAPAGMFFPFITGKNFLFRLAVELAFFLYIILSLVDRSCRPRWNALSISFAAFTAIIFLADIFAISPASAFWSNFERMEGFVTLAHLFVYFIIASTILQSKKDWETWLLSTTTVAVFMSLFCFLQLSGEAVINQGGVRVDGLLGNAAYLGAYLLFHIFFLLFLLVTRGPNLRGISNSLMAGSGVYIIYYLLRLIPEPKSGTHSLWGMINHNDATAPGLWLLAASVLIFVVTLVALYWQKMRRFERPLAFTLYGVTIASFFFIVYSTATRGATLGVIGGLFIAALYLALRGKESRTVKNLSIGAVAFVLLLVGGFMAVKNTDFVRNDPVLSRFASISWQDKTQAREYVWPMAIKGFQENPILGWGQEGFVYVFQKNYVPEMLVHEAWFDRAHNTFLDWLVAGGILGFLGYLSLYVLAVYLVLKSSVWNERGKAVLLGLIAAHAFQSLFIFDNLVSYLLFGSLLALIASGYNSGREVPAASDTEEAGVPLFVSALVVFVIVAFLINWSAYRQNVTLIKALSSGGQGPQVVLANYEKAIQYRSFGTFEACTQLAVATMQVVAAPQAPDAVKLAFATTTLSEFEKQIKETPNDARAYLSLGDFLSAIGSHDDAIMILEKARTLSPKKQAILLSLAQAYMRRAALTLSEVDMAAGLAIAKETYDAAPQFDSMKIAYAQVLLANKKPVEALAVLEKVENTRTLVDQNLMGQLLDNKRQNEAIALLRKEIANNDENPDAYVMLANIYLYLKDNKKAIQVFRDLIVKIPALKEAAEKDIAEIQKL